MIPEKLYVITSSTKPILIVENLNNPKVNESIDEFMEDINKEYTKHSAFPQNDRYYEIEFDKNSYDENTLRVFYSRVHCKFVFRYYELGITK